MGTVRKLKQGEVIILLHTDKEKYNFYVCPVHGVSARIKVNDHGILFCSREHVNSSGSVERIEDPIAYAKKHARKDDPYLKEYIKQHADESV